MKTKFHASVQRLHRWCLTRPLSLLIPAVERHALKMDGVWGRAPAAMGFYAVLMQFWAFLIKQFSINF